MNRIYIIGAALVLLFAVSCGGKKGEEAPLSISEMQWTKLSPDSLALQPIKAFDKDWMALSAGHKEMNSMTISWGEIGVLWNKPVVTVFVREERYTKRLIDQTGQFTLTIFPDDPKCKQALVYLGSHSRADEPDKMKNAGLSYEASEAGNPLIKEGILALECKVLYKDVLKSDQMPKDIKSFYDNAGLHTMYIAQILNIYTKSTSTDE